MIKRDLVAKKMELAKVYYNDQQVEVLPYIPLSSQPVLMKVYLDKLFEGSDIESNYLSAEWYLVLSMLDNLSSIKIVEETGNLTLDEIMDSGLWELVKSKITNYESFRKDLEIIVNRKLEQIALEKSIGVTIDKIADQAFLFLDRISKLDLSEKGIAELLDKLKKETKNFDATFGTTHTESE